MVGKVEAEEPRGTELEERNGGAGEVEGRQILEEQSMREESDQGPNVRQQRRVPGKEVDNGREPAAR